MAKKTETTKEEKTVENKKRKPRNTLVPALQLLVSPKGCRNKIYRQIVVPEDITFTDLCHIILDAYEFDYDHLYRFLIGPYYLEAEIPTDSELGADPEIKERLTVFNFEKDCVFYLHYDFGDDWMFVIKVLGKTECKKNNWFLEKEKGRLIQYPENGEGEEYYMFEK